MKRLGVLILVMLLLCGCGGSDEKMDRAMALRQRLLDAEECRFEATVTADYGETFSTFVLLCSGDREGNLTFEVLAPDTIGGITGTMNAQQGKLTFDDEVLVFEPLADGVIAPVTAPWIFLHTLRSGYLTACADVNAGLLLSIDDSYADDALSLEILLDENDHPKEAEIIWQGRRILSLKIEEFELL